MKKLTVIFCLCSALSMQAQQQATVKPAGDFTVYGEIFDAEHDETIPYATVKIFAGGQDQKPLEVMAADEHGKFSAAVGQKGDYLLVVEFIGKKSVRMPFSASDKSTVDLGSIMMNDDVQVLQEAVVSAQKNLVKVDLDKIAYSMEDDPEAKTNNVLEMLKKVPMVSVDGEENVQLKGSTDFIYYVNGKPSSMLKTNVTNVLKGMPAHTVKSIEIITDPGARYDAEGVAGIINIVTQKQSSLGGYTGSVTAYADDGGSVAASPFFSIKYGKIGFTGNFAVGRTGNIKMDYNSFREDYADASHHYLTQNNPVTWRGNTINASGELSYEMDTLNLITVSFNLNTQNRTTDSDADVWMRNSANETTYQYFRDGNATQESGNTGTGIDYQRSFSVKDRLLTTSYLFSTSSQDNSSDVTVTGVVNFGDDRNCQRSDAATDEHTFQLDYTTPVRKIHTVETGVKYIRRISKSASSLSRWSDDTWTDIFSDRDRFQHTQDIVAAYAGYGLRYKKWGFKAGVRFEGTWLNAEFPASGAMNFNADYANLIPSGLLTWQLTPTQALRGGYSMRLSRPGISYLNPYCNTSDTLYIQFGNPDLQAVRYHTFNLSYNYYHPKFSGNINLSYNQSGNALSEDTWLENGISYTTYKNIASAKRLNLAVLLSWRPAKKFSAYLNLRGDYVDLHSNENGNIHKTGYGGSISSGAQYMLTYDIRFNMVLYYSGPAISLQNMSGSYFFHNFRLTRAFLKNKLTVSAITYNPFSKHLTYTNTNDRQDFYYRMSRLAYRKRWVEFSVSYSFGEMKTRIRKAQRNIKNDDTMKIESSDN
jgi:outer membrane receptor protein involved in Fe transport